MAMSEGNQEFNIDKGYTHISLKEEEKWGLIVEGDAVNKGGQREYWLSILSSGQIPHG